MSGPGNGHREIDDEFDFHLRARIAELVEQGWAPEAARAEAMRRFGDLDEARRYCERADHWRETRMRRMDYVRQLWQDVTFAARSMQRAPSVATVALVTLALGIGVNAGIFGVAYGLLLRPLPFTDASRLTAIQFQEGYSVSKARLEAIRERQRVFDGIAAYSRWGSSLTSDGDPEILNGAVATANLFTVLGAHAAIGRTFHETDDQPGREPIVILSHGFWRRRFGGDTAVLGRAIIMDGNPRTVVGVMPPAFDFPARGRDFWIPTILDRADTNDYVAGYLLLVGRLQRDVGRSGAEADLRRVVRDLRLANIGGFTVQDEAAAAARPLRDVLVGPAGRRITLLLGSSAIVLLIACANVTSLLLARGVARKREIAIRAAVGAGRSRLVRQLLTESALLAVTGAVLGLATARAVSTGVRTLIPAEIVGSGTLYETTPVLLFAIVMSQLVGLGFGILPAVRHSRGDLALSLVGTRVGAGRATHRVLRSLVVLECAAAFVLALAAGLMVRSLVHLTREDPGFQPDGVLTLRVEPPGASYDTHQRRAVLFDDIMVRLRAIPGVVDAAAIQLLPLGDGNWNPSLLVEGRPLPAGTQPPEIDWRLVTPGYLRTMGIPLLKGRWFTDTDHADAPAVAVISEVTARRDFPDRDPIGQRVRTFFEGRGNWTTIVGVVASTRDQTLTGEARAQMYRPHAQHPLRGMAILIRGTGDPLALARPAREAIWSLDRNIPVADIRPLTSVISASIAERRALMLLVTSLGVLAVFLGAVGIYGVIAYSVSQRAFEIGLRMALGADRRGVVRLVLGDAVRLAVLGIALGLPAGLLLTRLLESQLHDVRPTDPLSIVAAIAVLLVIGAAAALGPARRATGARPADVLRGA